MAISVEDIKKSIKDYNYEVLTDGNDAVCQRAIDKAVLWTKAKILAADKEYEENSEIIDLIVNKRTLYELYSAAENEEVARDKKEDAMELLRAYFGPGVDSAGYQNATNNTPVAIGAIKNGPTHRD